MASSVLFNPRRTGGDPGKKVRKKRRTPTILEPAKTGCHMLHCVLGALQGLCGDYAARMEKKTATTAS